MPGTDYADRVPAGKLILLNGASSAGKSTVCRELQARLDEPFLQFSLDFLMFKSDVLPKRRDPEGPFAWASMRPRLFDAYYHCLTAFLRSGNNLVVDTIVETQEQLDMLVHLLSPFDVFYVGVHCPLPELERRERQRGDRRIGDARRDCETVHTFSAYDLEIDSSQPADENAKIILAAWKERNGQGIFQALAGN